MSLGFGRQQWRNHFLILLRKYFILFYFYPQSKFEIPTEIPVQKIEYPQNIISSEYWKLVSGPGVGNTVIFPCKMMAIMTP